jgi:hypothetical protein
LTPNIPNKKKTSIQNINKLIIYGTDLTKALIAIVSPSDLDIILKGLKTLAVLNIFKYPRAWVAEPPESPIPMDIKADKTITKSKQLLGDLK